MTDEQADKALVMLKGMQADLREIRRSMSEQNACLWALDDLFRATKVLMDTEH